MRHGGDIDDARAAYGEPADGWLDLSTGINPEPYPIGAVSAAAWYRLPQPGAEARLLTAARSAYGVPDSADVCCAPGTQVLIQLVARLRSPARVAVIGPTYSEHAFSWSAEGASVVTTSWSESAEADVVVVVNPNNPDGRVRSREEVLSAADRQARRGGLLVVDEAFAETRPDVAVAPFSGSPGLVVLRSFGKFYGLAGIRLGFAIGPTAEIARLRRWLGPWATSGPALELGARALADTAWPEQARRFTPASPGSAFGSAASTTTRRGYGSVCRVPG
jgi:cobalamin biosynthetic protein CobC